MLACISFPLYSRDQTFIPIGENCECGAADPDYLMKIRFIANSNKFDVSLDHDIPYHCTQDNRVVPAIGNEILLIHGQVTKTPNESILLHVKGGTRKIRTFACDKNVETSSRETKYNATIIKLSLKKCSSGVKRYEVSGGPFFSDFMQARIKAFAPYETCFEK